MAHPINTMGNIPCLSALCQDTKKGFFIMPSLSTADPFDALRTLTHKHAVRLLVTTTNLPDALEKALVSLLSTSWCTRLLVLTSSTSQAELLQLWPQLSLEHVPTQVFSVVPEPQTRICVTTARAIQVQQRLHGGTSCSFDGVLIYRMPRLLSPVWKQVLEQFENTPIIGLGEDFVATTMAWFEEQGDTHAFS
jgi:hypothetical protein